MTRGLACAVIDERRRACNGWAVEIVERIRGRLAVRAERGTRRPRFEHVADWREQLHSLIDAPGCTCSDFVDLWASVVSGVGESPHEAGRGYDAGKTLAEAVFIGVRHLRPAVVVETVVARGITSRVILEAMESNGHGLLFSIDLPPMNKKWRDEAGIAVPPRLRDRWTFVRGSSRQKLAPVLRRAGPDLPIFVHDSLHTYKNMWWEYAQAWPALSRGGLMISDDVEDNCAFNDFCIAQPGAPALVVKEEHRSGFIGVVQKPH